jgi:uncharacterized membrane protein (UPF0182 family)
MAKKKTAKKKVAKRATQKQTKKSPAEHLRPHWFKPGQSGNPGGRPKGTSLTDRLRALVEEGEKGKTADAICKAAVEAAKSGDFRFFQEILNRLDGKVPDKLASQGQVEVIIRHQDATPTDDD